MRTRCLCGLTLLVVLLHVAAWQAVADRERPLPAAAGVRWVVLAHAPPTRAGATPSPSPSPAGAGAAPSSALASAAPSPALAGAPLSRAPAGARASRVSASAPRAPRALAGARGAAPAAAPRAPDWPVYATRVPPSVRVTYRLVDGLAMTRGAGPGGSAAVDGSADLDWHRDGDAFVLRLVTAPPDRPPREWEGRGAFDSAGVAPSRLVQRERGREVRAVDFDRAAGRVRFSGAAPALAFATGAQDRWSWIAQLAAIAEARAADGAVVPPGTAWELQVAGLRGELARWRFQVLADARPPPELAGPAARTPAGDGRASGLLHVVREAERPYDLRIEAWLSPALHHFPAGLRMSTPPGPWSLALWSRADAPGS